jgi:hypothetical protein
VVPPAPEASTTPAAPGKAPAVLNSLPDTEGVLGGKVAFAKEAFPILADHREEDVQHMIRQSVPRVCPGCHGNGSVSKKESIQPSSTQAPIVKQWDEPCPECGGFKNIVTIGFAKQLTVLVDMLSHMKRGEKFADIRTAAEERLKLAFEKRDKTWQAQKCQPIRGMVEERYRDIYYGGWLTRTVVGITGLQLVPADTKHYKVDIPDAVTKLWNEAKLKPAAGQAVLTLGTTSERVEVGGWVWMKMQTDGGSAAIILCGTPSSNTVPQGHIVLGGLLVGKWTPGTTATASAMPAPAAMPRIVVLMAPATDSPGALFGKVPPATGSTSPEPPSAPPPASPLRPPRPPATPPAQPPVAGPSLPVILAVAAVAGN